MWPPPTPNRIFLERAKAGRRFPRVNNPGAGARNCANEVPSEGSNPAEALQYIERDTFPGQQRARARCYTDWDLTGSKLIAVAKMDLRSRRGIQQAEDFDEQIDPCKDQRRLGDQLAVRALRGRNDRIGGDVSRADVLRQK